MRVRNRVTGFAAAIGRLSHPFQLYGDGLALNGNPGDAVVGPLAWCSPCQNGSTVNFCAFFTRSPAVFLCKVMVMDRLS